VSQQLARRLLTYEAPAGKNSEPRSQRLFASVRSCAPAPLFTCGSCGVSLPPFPCSGAGQGGSSQSEYGAGRCGWILKGLDEPGPQKDKDISKEGGAILIAQLLGLLLTFIGEGITLHLVQDVWPESAFDDRDSRKEKKG